MNNEALSSLRISRSVFSRVCFNAMGPVLVLLGRKKQPAPQSSNVDYVPLPGGQAKNKLNNYVTKRLITSFRRHNCSVAPIPPRTCDRFQWRGPVSSLGKIVEFKVAQL